MIIQNNVNLNQGSKRNLGIELLRIVSMFMIVVHHCLLHGGMLNNINLGSVNYNAAWLLNIVCLGAVNLFALTTGYVCIKSKHRWSRILQLWLEVVFYSVLFTVIFSFATQGSVDMAVLIKAFLPVLGAKYWYFSAYFGVFVFIPFLNILINNLSKKQHKQLIITGFIIFCIIPVFAANFGGDIFDLDRGYSMIWLMALYIVGAYICLYQADFKRHNTKFFFLGYLLCTFLAWISMSLISFVTLHLFGEVRYAYIFLSYLSPLLTGASVCLFIFFAKLQIQRGKNLIMKIASASFAVYLISEHPWIRSQFITDRFIYFVHMPWYLMVASVLLAASFIYIICTVIDLVRKKLFEWLHISTMCDKVIQRVILCVAPLTRFLDEKEIEN